METRKYKIAVGRSRKDRNWVNQETTWEEFVKTLSNPRVTPETFAEYKAMTKVGQGDTKDGPGFVAGYVKDGRRKESNIVSRSMITLDIDFATKDFWTEFALEHDYQAVLYSTHSHADNNPRYRLLLPINRDVTPDEYTAIARSVAHKIGIDLFDDTTYQANRLMYFPSCSSDVTPVFKQQAGKIINADEVLSEYDNWQDVGQWFTSSREATLVEKSSKSQQDPTTKEGIIGAFCRAYPIKDVLDEILSDVYEKTSDSNRYTFKGGSSQGGLVVYDNKFAYSNHGTDPASQQTCNAFDLVRIHRFGELDDEAKDNTPINRMPSYLAMMEYVGENDKAITELATTEIKANFDTSAMSPEDVASEAKWQSKLKRNKKTKKIESTSENVVLIMDNHKPLHEAFAYDVFANRAVATKSLPWRNVDANSRDIKDSDDNELRFYLEKHYNITNASKIEDAVVHVTMKNSYHPIKDYLTSLTWDGEERLDTMLVDYMGADDNDYVRAITRKTFTAAVARVYEPGIKFDYMLTLVGAQGIGKSTLFAKMAGEHFSDSITNPGSKDAYEQLQGVWISEIAELAALKNAEVEVIKNFISKTHDRFRVAYGKRTENFPRQGILVGSTNESTFLKDKTGNRRFWAVEVYEPKVSIHDELTQDLVDQLWAEAKHRYDAGEELYLSKEIEAMANEQQDMFSELDGREGMIIEYLNTLLPATWSDYTQAERIQYFKDDADRSGTIQRTRVCATEVLVELFGKSSDDINRATTKDINSILEGIDGWKRADKVLHFGSIYGKQRGYERV